MMTMIELKAKKLSAAQIVPTVKLRFFSTPRSSSGGWGNAFTAAFSATFLAAPLAVSSASASAESPACSDSFACEARYAALAALNRRAPCTCRRTNHTMPARPISMAAHTIGCVNGYDSMFVKPNIRPPKPMTDSPTEKKSARALGSFTPKLRRPKMASSSEITPMTVRVRKMERQPFASVCHPPMVGPTAGATLMAMPTVPMAMPRRDNG